MKLFIASMAAAILAVAHASPLAIPELIELETRQSKKLQLIH